MYNLNEIDAIVFDLGGVILNIDPERTSGAFKKLGFTDIDNYFSRFDLDHVFLQLELGKISEEEFCENVRSWLGREVSNEEIAAAWTAMIQDIPAPRMDVVKNLSKKCRTFMLSNTNVIHWRAFDEYMDANFGERFSDIMEKVYTSHELNMRKPNVEIYEHILKDSAMEPSRTLFIDDSEKNLEGAAKAGMKTYHMKIGNDLSKEIFLIFNNYN